MNTTDRIKWFVGVVLVATTAVTLVFVPPMVQFWEFTPDDVVRLFTRLILISLLLERALEVFVGGVRQEDDEQLRRKLEEAEDLVKKGGSRFETDVAQAKVDLIEYRAGTRRLTFMIAMTLGILLGLVGVRTLQFLAEPNALSQLPQKNYFILADVLLTGAMLGGGASGLHKIVSLFLESVDKYRDRIAKP